MTQPHLATRPAGRVPRVLVVAAVVSALTALLGVTLARVALQARGTLSGPVPGAPADALVGLVAGAGSGLCLWLGAGFLLSLGAALPGQLGSGARWVSRRVTPQLVRRLAVTALGGAIVASGAVPARAATPTGPLRTVTLTAWSASDTGPDAPTSGSVPAAPAGLSPDLLPPVTVASPRPTDPSSAADPWAAPAARPAASGTAGQRTAVPPTPSSVTSTGTAVPGLGALGPRPPRAAAAAGRDAPGPGTSAGSVTVTTGDTLWDLAATALGPGADAGAISREWPRWFTANRAVIGADPDHLEPGQSLVAPRWTSDAEGR